MIPVDQDLRPAEHGKYLLPEGTVLATSVAQKRVMQIFLPQGKEVKEVLSDDPDKKRFRFPAKSVTGARRPLDAGACSGHCSGSGSDLLVGDIYRAMLPLVLRALGRDPALAASPLVATFVDVTGIYLYFQIAKLYLL